MNVPWWVDLALYVGLAAVNTLPKTQWTNLASAAMLAAKAWLSTKAAQTQR